MSSYFLPNETVNVYNVTVSNATANWTELEYGTFKGLTKNSWSGIMDLWGQNLYPQYTMDCAQHDAPPPNFFTVFGVLFSGVTGEEYLTEVTDSYPLD